MYLIDHDIYNGRVQHAWTSVNTVLSLSANSMHELTTKINQELESVDNWLKCNKLSLNYSKTQYMLFTKQNENIDTNFNAQINNHLLSRTECVQVPWSYN